MWTATCGQILTLNNLMLRGRPLVNHCCLCCCNTEFVDHLLLFCLIAHSLWMYMLRLFEIEWVMPSSVVNLLFSWYHWLGKHSSNIWDLVPDCLMWTIWTKRNRWSFEDEGKIMAQLIEFRQRTIFDWSQCWGFLRLFYPFGFSFIYQNRLGAASVFLFLFFPLFTTMNSLCFSYFSFINNILFLLIKKQK